MWLITLRGVTAHKARYVLTALAVMLGVAFVAGTLILTDTINHTFDSLYTQIYNGTDAVVRASQAFNPGTNFSNQRDMIDASLQKTVDSVPGVAATALDVDGYAQLIGRDGKPLGHPVNGPPTIGLAWTPITALNPLRLVAGHGPVALDQIVIDKHSADTGHLHVGDRVQVLTKLPPAAYTVSGVATWGTASSPLGATIVAFNPAQAPVVLTQPGKVNQIDVTAAPNVSQTELAGRIRSALHDPSLQVVTGRQVTAEGQSSIHKAFSFLTTFLLVFAGIALFVGSFLIFNTFSIIVTQRVRELGLLRAVGASRRQVGATVAGESLIIGVVASAVGLAVGAGLALLLKAGMGLLGFVVPATGLVFLPRTALVGLIVGTTVTVVAAFIPARKAARISPVAAMSRAASAAAAPPARRAWIGVLLLGVGAALLAYALSTHPTNQLTLVGLAAAAVLLGTGRLGPFFARPVSQFLGAPFELAGVSGHLGRDNASRTPARTYSTASALMIGVALVSVMTILAGSSKATIDSVVDSSVKADFVINSNANPGTSFGFSPDLAATIAALPEVSATASVRSGIAQIYGGTTSLVALDASHVAPLLDLGVTHGSIPGMTAGGVAVSTNTAGKHHLGLGSPLTITFPTTGAHVYRVEAIYKAQQLAGDYVLTTAAADANFPQQLDSTIYVGLAPGVTAAAGRQAIKGVASHYPTAKVLDQAQYKAQESGQVDQLLNLIYALLALAVIIALIGIANTLALSIHERVHELGLLRAVGMTRGQLRATIRVEALIISLFGSLEGLLIGTVLGAALVSAEGSSGLTELSIPLAQLLAIAVLAGLAGLVAAWRPSQRAARIDILRAVATE